MGRGNFEEKEPEQPTVKYMGILSMCGGDAACCQITLTTCLYNI